MTDDLRTALAELADDWTGTGSGTADVISRELRRLLAAHPARPTLAHAYLNPINNEGSEAGCALWLPDGGVCGQARSAHPCAPVSDTRREDVARMTPDQIEIVESAAIDELQDDENEGLTSFDLGVKIAHAVLAVLPAPPVVDEAEIEAAAKIEARVRFRRQRMNVGTPQDREEQAFREGAVFAARLRGATRG